MTVTLICKSKFWYFQSKNQLYLFSHLPHSISCIFLHQYATGYTLNPLHRNATKKQTVPLWKDRQETFNSGCLWGKEKHGWRRERIDFSQNILLYLFNFIQCECITYFLKKTCLTKLLPSVRYFWLTEARKVCYNSTKEILF